MWDLPRPGLEPVSPALAGRLPTTAPPGKPSFFFFNVYLLKKIVFVFIYLFIWPHQVLVAAHRIFVRGSFLEVCRLSSCGARAPECVGSVAPRHVGS